MPLTLTVNPANRNTGERKAPAAQNTSSARLVATPRPAAQPPRAAAAAVGQASAPAQTDRAQISGEAQAEGSSSRSRLGEYLDLASLAIAPIPTLARRGAELVAVQTGLVNPADDSRLGAYEATGGHERGTVGRGANNSIAGIYMLFGTFGQDRIGDVFHSRQAQETLPQSVNSEANGRLARTEFGYWENQWNSQGTEGGFLGSRFSPAVRESIQSWMSMI